MDEEEGGDGLTGVCAPQESYADNDHTPSCTNHLSILVVRPRPAGR